MRFTALGFPLLGSTLCVVLGFAFVKHSETHSLGYDVEEALRPLASEWTMDDLRDPSRVQVRKSDLRRGATATEVERLSEQLREKNEGTLSGRASLPGLFIGAVLGVLGGGLAAVRQGKAGTILLISAALGPELLLGPKGVLATFPFFLAAILAVLSPSRPATEAETPAISNRSFVIGAIAIAGVYWVIIVLGLVGVWPKGFKIAVVG